jgi:hypothetical protein
MLPLLSRCRYLLPRHRCISNWGKLLRARVLAGVAHQASRPHYRDAQALFVVSDVIVIALLRQCAKNLPPLKSILQSCLQSVLVGFPKLCDIDPGVGVSDYNVIPT